MLEEMLEKTFKMLDKGLGHCKRMFIRGASEKLAVWRQLLMQMVPVLKVLLLDVLVWPIFLVGMGEHLQGVMRDRTLAREHFRG